MSNIGRYFRKILCTFTDPRFYSNYVHLPDSDETPQTIRNNTRLYPFFKDALGTIDGTHILCLPSQDEWAVARNRKGLLTQNCLTSCDFDLRFLYVLSGWEGSTADSTLYYNARQKDFPIPQGKYYLADAGFPLCPELLVPYRGVRYHLQEWRQSDRRCVYLSPFED